MKGDGQRARIVVGVDGSEGSRGALRWALAEARLRQRPLHVIYAHGPPYVGPRGPGLRMLGYLADEAGGNAEDTLSSSLDGIVDPAADDEVAVSAEVVRAPPQVALVDASEAAELLVVGARGAQSHLLGIGSVSGACCRGASCPVVVVPTHRAAPSGQVPP